MCRVLHISAGDSLEFNLQGRTILVTKHEESCIFCGETSDLVSYKGRPICAACRETIKDL
jgi:transcriptional pleiotropic regulator of transition state genes